MGVLLCVQEKDEEGASRERLSERPASQQLADSGAHGGDHVGSQD